MGMGITDIKLPMVGIRGKDNHSEPGVYWLGAVRPEIPAYITGLHCNGSSAPGMNSVLNAPTLEEAKACVR